MRNRTRIAVIALVAMLGIGAAGLAWAYFTGTTNATASGGVGGSLTSLEQVSTQYVYEPGQTALYPGHAADVRIEVKNNNQVPVEIVTITAGAINTTTPGCATALETVVSGHHIEGASPANSFVIAAGATVVLKLPAGVKMKTTADNSCAGTGFATSWSIGIENR